MKIQQETVPYQPITIELETQAEAEAFFGVIDKCEPKHSVFTTAERQMLIDLSNKYSNMDVTF